MNFMMRPCDKIVIEWETKQKSWKMSSCILGHVAKSQDASFLRQGVCGRAKVEASTLAHRRQSELSNKP